MSDLLHDLGRESCPSIKHSLLNQPSECNGEGNQGIDQIGQRWKVCKEMSCSLVKAFLVF